MASFYLYLDESGKLGGSPYTSLCGYVTHLAEWQRIQTEWANLSMALDVPPIHMRCIVDPERERCAEWLKTKNQWGSNWEARSKEIINSFAFLLMNSHAVCVGSTVDSAHFEKLPDDSQFKQQLKNPLYMSFHHAIMTALDKIDRIGDDQHLCIVLDEDRDYAMKCYDVLLGLRIAFEKVRKRVDSICFGSSKAFPALQAADMIAYESRNLMIQQMQDPNTEISDVYKMLTRKGIHRPHLYNATVLDRAHKHWGKDAKEWEL
jgi:hypothetical protein